MQRLVYIFLFLLMILKVSNMTSIVMLNKPVVLGSSNTALDQASPRLEKKIALVTKTNFLQQEIIEEEPLSYETAYIDDPNMEYGLEEVINEGVPGKIIRRFLVTSWLGEEFYRDLISKETVDPKTENIARGTKIVWRSIATEYGELKYWRKLHVWATKYDGNCVGCRGLTYSGTLVRKGVCAVDPKVISLGTNFYVEGYGMCRSEDIGGGIKGNKVDLGYEDVTKGAWRTGFTNVYLLTSAPEN